MAIYGYARVSTEDRELGLQITALTEAGVAKADIVHEKASGSRKARTGRSMPSYWRSCATVTSLWSGRSIVSAARRSTHSTQRRI